MLFSQNGIVEATNEDLNDFKKSIEVLKPDKNMPPEWNCGGSINIQA